jgi:hypothetical protein
VAEMTAKQAKSALQDALARIEVLEKERRLVYFFFIFLVTRVGNCADAGHFVLTTTGTFEATRRAWRRLTTRAPTSRSPWNARRRLRRPRRGTKRASRSSPRITWCSS